MTVRPNSAPRDSIVVLATACGLAVVNLNCIHPLLPLLAETFGRTNDEISLVATLTQASYAAGLLIFAPLGDVLDRRRLILGLLTINIASLVGAALAPTFASLLAASLVVGCTSVSAQIVIPAVSLLAAPEERGKKIGIVMTGLFAGMLLSRTLSGIVGECGGWRAMYWVAAGLDLVLIGLISFTMPRIAPAVRIPYARLVGSLWTLLHEERVLQIACVTGFLMFAAFNALWGTLAYLVAQPPYGFGAHVAGSFGLAGAIGMLASPAIGSLTDRIGGRRMVGLGATLAAGAFALFAWGEHLWLLITGVIVLDLGSRAALVGNQVRIYALAPGARGRVNTIFMTCYFLGGACGTWAGAAASELARWSGLAVTGGLLAAIVAISQNADVFSETGRARV